MSRRLARVNELLKREIASELYRVMNESGFDLAAVTVTRVETSPNLRHAHVKISIRGEPDEKRKMLSLIERHRKTIQHDLNKNTTLKYTPRLEFELDESIQQGDKVLAIITEMEERDETMHPTADTDTEEDQN